MKFFNKITTSLVVVTIATLLGGTISGCGGSPTDSGNPLKGPVACDGKTLLPPYGQLIHPTSSPGVVVTLFQQKFQGRSTFYGGECIDILVEQKGGITALDLFFIELDAQGHEKGGRGITQNFPLKSEGGYADYQATLLTFPRSPILIEIRAVTKGDIGDQTSPPITVK